MTENRYTIELLGASISIRTEEDLLYIKKLVKSVEAVTQDVKSSLGLRDPLSVAIMAAVFLADENLRLKTRNFDSSSMAQFTIHKTQTEEEYSAERASDALAHIEDMLDRTLRRY